MNIDFNQLKQKLLPYFIDIYGEEFKDLIITRMNQIEPVFYTTVDGKKNEMFTKKTSKRIELTLKFLDHHNIVISEEIRSQILKTNSAFGLSEVPEAINLLKACFGTHEYSEYGFGGIKDISLEPTDREYIINKSVEALKHHGISVDPSNYNEWILSDQAKQVFERIRVLQEYISTLDIEFRDFDKQFDSLNSLIDKSNNIENETREKYTLEFLKSIEQYTTKHDKQALEQYLNSENKDWYSFTRQVEMFKITGNSFYENGLLEAFGSKADEKLNDPETSKYARQTIIENKIKYFRLIGLYQDQLPPEKFILTNEALQNAPKQEFIDEIIAKKEYYGKLAEDEIISITSSYNENIERINGLNLADIPDFEIDDVKNQTICIFPSVKIVDDTPEAVAILCFSPEACLPAYIDTMFIHEINHAIELSLLDYDNNKYLYKCGFETLTNEEGESREYEGFSEVINQIIAMEITEAMHKDGVYLFDNPNTSKIKGGTSYEYQRNIIEGFWENFKKEIMSARVNNNLDSLFAVVGKENFENLNDIINEHTGLPYYAMMNDVINNRTTKLTEKRTHLYNKTFDTLNSMINHVEQVQEHQNLTARAK